MSDRPQFGDAERRLNAVGLYLEEQDFGGAVDAGVCGCILAAPAEGGNRFRAVSRPGMHGWMRETFAEWAASRFARFADHGPGPDGWQEQSGGGTWQLWARLTQMPSLD
jgi:hypothetical protein